jgi:hypothetical protein
MVYTKIKKKIWNNLEIRKRLNYKDIRELKS